MENGQSVSQGRKTIFSNDDNWNHLGGWELMDGETVQYNANWERGVSTMTIDPSSISSLDATADATAYVLYGATADAPIYYTSETWTNWDNQPETERTYFDENGAKVGSSHTHQNVYDHWNGSGSVTNVNTNYEKTKSDGTNEWAGNEFSETQGSAVIGSGSFITSSVLTSQTDAWAAIMTEFDHLVGEGLSLSADGLTYTDYSDQSQTATTLKVERNTNVWTDADGNATTEVRNHLMSSDWNHLGGYEVIDGETVQFNANWERGAVKIDASGLSALAADITDGAAYEVTLEKAYVLYVTNTTSTNVVYKVNSNTYDWGTETEISYIDSDTGAVVGSSRTNVNTWEDWQGNTITSTNTNFNDANWEWLGSSFEEKNSDGDVTGSGSNFPAVVTQGTDAWTALVAEFTWLDNLTAD